MNKEMVERVARAIWADRLKQLNRAGFKTPINKWEDETEACREEQRETARVAIQAIRDPNAATWC